jgi:hypothetical protein
MRRVRVIFQRTDGPLGKLTKRSQKTFPNDEKLEQNIREWVRLWEVNGYIVKELSRVLLP